VLLTETEAGIGADTGCGSGSGATGGGGGSACFGGMSISSSLISSADAIDRGKRQRAMPIAMSLPVIVCTPFQAFESLAASRSAALHPYWTDLAMHRRSAVPEHMDLRPKIKSRGGRRFYSHP
jgi:hypothetical protein